MLPVILLPAEVDLVSKERCGKENLVSPPSSIVGKVVLTLLTEVIALHVGFSLIHVQGTGFQKFIPRFLRGGRSSSLQDGLKNAPQVFLGILKDWECSNGDNSNKNVYFRGSSGLVIQFVTQLGRWRGVKGNNGVSDRGKDGKTLLAGTSAALD